MEKTQKKRIKRYLLWGGAAVLVAILALMPLLAKNGGTSDGPTASIITTTVETGTISSSLRGGGTITVDGTEDVTIPSGVKITEFLVKNGDYVTEGTPVATVDKVSVMTAITELNDTLKYLREELEDARNEKVSASITATAGGRVKKVFAEVGDSVQDVMLRDGALAILSLDGKMAVKLEENLAVTTGEAVTVTLADGEEVEGRVESNLEGVVVITVEDEGYEVGQSVTVSQNGETLGQSALYIHSAWKATAYSGTVETVSAKEEKTLSSGATLFTLKDRDFEGELQRRANQHREYEELLQELLTMYESGVLTAPCDGEVSGVDKDSAHLLAATEDGWVLTTLDATQQSWSVTLLSNVVTTGNEQVKVCNGKADCPLTPEEHPEGAECLSLCTEKAGCTSKIHKDTCITRCTHADDPEKCPAINHYEDCIKACTHGTKEGECTAKKHYLTCIESCISSDGTKNCPATGNHKTTCIASCTHADDAAGCPSTKYHYPDCVKNCINSASADTVCTSGKHLVSCYFYGMTYKATAVKLEAVGTQLLVKPDTSGKVYTVQYGTAGWEIVGDTLTTTTLIGASTPIDAANVTSFQGKEGSVLLLITGYKGEESIYMGPVVYAQAASGGASGFPGGSGSLDMSGMMAGMGSMDISSMIGGLSGYGNYSGSYTANTEDLFDLKGDTLLTVTPRDTVTLSISIDEHDISKIQLGQKATVKVAALKGQEYEAEVTAIAASGTNNGGSSKFSVELTFAMDEQLLSGMSASAVIPMESREGLRIPAAALQQDGARTYVYTALDDNGQPAKPVDVETGLSDGEYVEILSGLEEGQQVCYCYYDVLELDTSAKADKYSFG